MDETGTNEAIYRTLDASGDQVLVLRHDDGDYSITVTDGPVIAVANLTPAQIDDLWRVLDRETRRSRPLSETGVPPGPEVPLSHVFRHVNGKGTT